MSRVKRGTTSLKRRKNVLAAAKGFRFGRKSKERDAKVALRKAGVYAFAHRKDKKSDFRGLWMVRLNAALRPLGWSFSKFIGALKKQESDLNRKVLSEIAHQSPESFARIVGQVSK
jgi:large subunit ribosomal protein L20